MEKNMKTYVCFACKQASSAGSIVDCKGIRILAMASLFIVVFVHVYRTTAESEMHPMKKKLNVHLFTKVTRCLRLPQKTYMDTLTFGAPSIKVLDFEFPVVCMETIMHLTCMNMPVEKIDHALNTIKVNGIQNVLAFKGDPPHGQDKFVQVAGGFACALDLVQHIRAKYGDYFGITVAGYPKAHPDMIQGDEGATLEAYNSDLAYLKRKTLSVVLKFWKSFSHVKILELCEIFILWSAIREA
ncbi:hypothetical protein ZIOFF_006275 [Zingiber officinale]|uniref:Methylenetetrahydrofolate reductase n=1 Tax=Zingiber officinale TaxID=94328 RepID=A0A8J5HPK2_ZINOF|nr:hypothetical protein ZIOFF_006275 [Zingiber officinale]